MSSPSSDVTDSRDAEVDSTAGDTSLNPASGIAGGNVSVTESNDVIIAATAAAGAAVAAAAAAEVAMDEEGGVESDGAVAAASVVTSTALAIGSGEFVSKEHARAGPFKAVLLYLDYVRWLWIATDKSRLDRQQAEACASERVRVRIQIHDHSFGRASHPVP